MKLFDLIDNEDLNTTKSYHTAIYTCPVCNALFGMKACGNRAMFSWFGYHPTDGDCLVVTDDWRFQSRINADGCECSATLVRIRTIEELSSLVPEEFRL